MCTLNPKIIELSWFYFVIHYISKLYNFTKDSIDHLDIVKFVSVITNLYPFDGAFALNAILEISNAMLKSHNDSGQLCITAQLFL